MPLRYGGRHLAAFYHPPSNRTWPTFCVSEPPLSVEPEYARFLPVDAPINWQIFLESLSLCLFLASKTARTTVFLRQTSARLWKKIYWPLLNRRPSATVTDCSANEREEKDEQKINGCVRAFFCFFNKNGRRNEEIEWIEICVFCLDTTAKNKFVDN